MNQGISTVRRFAIKMKSSEFVRNAKANVGYLPYLAKISASHGLVYDIRDKMGMGAILSAAVRIHAWAEDNGCPTSIISTSPLYSDGADVLATFFDRPPVLAEADYLGTFSREWVFRKAIPQAIPLERATDIFQKFFQTKDHLARTVAAVGGDSRFDLSIHFRGTDKFLESGLVKQEALLEMVGPYLEMSERVFLATDDETFAMTVRGNFPKVTFVSYDLGKVASGVPRHFSDLSAYDKALEALVNIFLIARAPVCIRTSSYLSAISKFVNPQLKTVTINQTLSKIPRFPEQQILQQESS